MFGRFESRIFALGDEGERASALLAKSQTDEESFDDE
jgi:hypothetical protein